MARRPGYTVEEARADAREWIKGTTTHDGTRGWRVACALLDERIAELETAIYKSWSLLGPLSMGVEGAVRREVCTASNILGNVIGKGRSSHGDTERE